ncbi:MAG TPA: hypothetical protein DCR40_18410 [Prolixibacteraceae bacterium]|nr:hypothetical protein [Prolixibacteraceae bacterium]
MKTTINIQKVLPSTITSRKAVELINREMPLISGASVIFDFANIDFISRAFADELIHFIADKNISAEFRNANTIITEMLAVVQKNRKKRDSSFHHIAITPFMNQKEFTKFLSMI